MASEISQDEKSEEKDLGYEIFIALVSVLSIFNLAFVLLPGMDPDAVNVVNIINLALTIIFLFDFGYRITTTRSKSYYFIRDYGWADLLACAPQLRFLRLFRIFKAYRLVKKYGTNKIVDYLSYHRAEAALYILIFCVMIILEFGASLVLIAEGKSPDANITTAGDAIWWAYVTITTVGYGDQFPVTTGGRLVGILVMTTGVGIFATFAGYISNKLLTPPQKDEDKKPEEDISPFERQVITGMDEIKLYISQQERKNQDLTGKLEHLENLIKAGK
jgi:voltage-gated potassium channel